MYWSPTTNTQSTPPRSSPKLGKYYFSMCCVSFLRIKSINNLTNVLLSSLSWYKNDLFRHNPITTVHFQYFKRVILYFHFPTDYKFLEIRVSYVWVCMLPINSWQKLFWVWRKKKKRRKTKTPWPIFQPRGGSSEEISVRGWRTAHRRRRKENMKGRAALIKWLRKLLYQVASDQHSEGSEAGGRKVPFHAIS